MKKRGTYLTHLYQVQRLRHNILRSLALAGVSRQIQRILYDRYLSERQQRDFEREAQDESTGVV